MNIKNILLLITIGILAISCNKATTKEEKQKSIQITDFYNRTISLDKHPQRIVSVSPAITELIFELGCSDKLIARTDFCIYPQQTKSITSIGGINNANLEKIISLQPDIVIGSSIFTKKMLETIERASIPVLLFPERTTVEGVYQTISSLGEVLNKRDKADSIINAYKQRLSVIEKKVSDKKRPKVYYVIQYGQTGDFSAGENTFINDIIRLSGGDNIAKKTKNWSFSKEEIFANQPDYIFLRREDSAGFVNMQPYKDLKAVKEKKVYGIESSIIDIQSSRSILAIEYISNIINNS